MTITEQYPKRHRKPSKSSGKAGALSLSGPENSKKEQLSATGPIADKLPLLSLLALAMAGFITILTEALPAGLLPQISNDIHVSQSLVGQFVTIYAVGSFVAAIPLTSATLGWRRKPLLLLAIAGFLVGNIITATSTSYALTMIARAFAGVSAGLLWALLAGYAARMVPPALQGRAIAIAMVGTPLALSVGIPAGTYLGILVGWRVAFGLLSVATILLCGWVYLCVPDYPGQKASERRTLSQVLRIKGLKSVLAVTLAFVMAHNVLYTYIASFLAISGSEELVSTSLLVFGVAALAGIFIVGPLIDRWLRELTLASVAVFALTATALGIWQEHSTIVVAGMAAWGLAFGGAATLFQTASAKTAKDDADTAQSMIVTAWNLAIAAGGILGGFLLDASGAGSMPWVLAALLVGTLVVTWRAREGGFPATVAKRSK